MSEKKCYTCKHYFHGSCNAYHADDCGDDLQYWESIEQKHDAVDHPAHYRSGGIECIDCIKAALGENYIGFLIGNVIKYVYRYKDKNGVEDLAKARWYLDRAIKELENEE